MTRALCTLLLVVMIGESASAGFVDPGYKEGTIRIYKQAWSDNGKVMEQAIKKSGSKEELIEYQFVRRALEANADVAAKVYYDEFVQGKGEFGKALQYAIDHNTVESEYFANEFTRVANEIAEIEANLKNTNAYRSPPKEQQLALLGEKIEEARKIHERAIFVQAFASAKSDQPFQFLSGLTAYSASMLTGAMFLTVGLVANRISGLSDLQSALASLTGIIITLYGTFKGPDKAAALTQTLLKQLKKIRIESSHKDKAMREGYWATLRKLSHLSPATAMVVNRLMTSLVCRVHYEDVPKAVSPKEVATPKLRVAPVEERTRIAVPENDPPRTRVHDPIIEEFEPIDSGVREGVRNTQKRLQKRLPY